MRRLTFLGLMLVFIACSNGKKVQSDEKPVSESVEKQEDSLFLSFERTRCFGECPAYRITVNSKGECLYEGFKFVEKTGNYTAKIKPEQMKEIRKMAEEYGFFQMKDKYDGNISDLPSVLIEMSTEEERKRVVDRFEPPQELRDFEKYLDKILLNLDWEKQD